MYKYNPYQKLRRIGGTNNSGCHKRPGVYPRKSQRSKRQREGFGDFQIVADSLCCRSGDVAVHKTHVLSEARFGKVVASAVPLGVFASQRPT